MRTCNSGSGDVCERTEPQAVYSATHEEQDNQDDDRNQRHCLATTRPAVSIGSMALCGWFRSYRQIFNVRRAECQHLALD